MTLVSIHQPDLLPYSGFWFKMAVSDVFVVARHDQFQKHGYQRRVAMRESWVSHQLVGKPSLVPITDIGVAPGWQDRLGAAIRGRYRGATHWKERGEALCERIDACSGDHLDEVNLALIHVIRETLGISTELAFTDPPTGSGRDRLVEQVRAVGGSSYLSGTGGASYLGDTAEDDFAAEGIELQWSHHRPVTGDSVVTLLMDHDDPLAAVLAVA